MTTNDVAERETMLLKVGSQSNPHKVATSIYKNMEEGKTVVVVSVGAGALNQGVKALIIANGISAPHGWIVNFRPGFEDLTINNETKTAIKMILKRE